MSVSFRRNHREESSGELMKSQVMIKSDAQRIVYAPVYTPYRVDTDHEAMLPDQVERMAHGFMLNGRHDRIDINHDGVKSGCIVVESFVARNGDPDFIEGEWILGIKIAGDALWNKVLKGELNGLSFASENVPTRTAYVVDLLTPVAGRGTTEPVRGVSLPEHRHEVSISFTKDAHVIPTFTEEAMGHRHRITRMTATESECDHAHRMVIIVE